mgnify:CR=1 FL=1
MKKILIVYKDNTTDIGVNHGDCWIGDNRNTHRFYWDECNVYLIPEYK